jgi:hypothetical protein
MFGPAAFFQKRSHRHPREKVLNTLVMLLWEPSALNSDQARRLQYALPLSANSMSKPVEAYKDFWRRLS